MPVIMRLYRRKDSPNWYVEIERGKSVSLKTENTETAKQIFREMEKEELRVKLHLLDESERITLLAYKKKYLEPRQSLSGNTLRADELALRLLGDAVGHNTAVRLINVESIEKFKTICLGRGVKPKSVNTYLRHIKAALREAKENGYIKKTPRIRFLKEPKRLPEIFARDDLERILKKIRSEEFELWRIVQFALWTAARRSEIITLNWSDIREDHCRFIGKGNKERWVDLLPGATEALGPRNDIGRVFHAYHKDTISHRFKRYINDLGISGRFHMLRHTSATAMLNSGIPLPVIQAILGHSDISTTQIYAKVYDDLRKREMQKLKF